MDYFIHENGNRSSRLNGKKDEDESSLRSRLADSGWNVNEVECVYDAEGNCLKAPAYESSKSKRNRKSSDRKKTMKAKKAAEASTDDKKDEKEPAAPEGEADKAEPEKDEPKEEKGEPEVPRD
jgi:hypothetical protein